MLTRCQLHVIMLTIRHENIVKEGDVMKYYLLKCLVNGEDYQEESYGLLLIDEEQNRKYICNVTSDFSKMKQLVDDMNEFNVEPCHTENVIEDFKYLQAVGECT